MKGAAVLIIRLLGFVLLVAGGVFGWLGVQDGIATWKRLGNAEDVVAEIARLDPQPGSAEIVPVAAYRGDDGKAAEFRLPPADPADYTVGQPVHLMQPAGRPDLIQSGDLIAVWSPVAIPVGGGALAVIFGLALMTSRRRRPEEMPRLHFLIRLVLLAGACGLTYLAWQQYETVVATLNHFPRAQGEVIALEADGAPKIQFKTVDGVAIDFTDHSVAPGSYRQGQRVTLTYVAGDATGARIEPFWSVWSVPVTWGAIAGAAFFVALFAASLRRGKRALEPKPAPPPPAERRDPSFGSPGPSA